jgi:hypothetical protein
MSLVDDVLYHGNCHCGRYRFQVSAPRIDSAISCTCSLCAKKGYLWLLPAEGSFTVVKDEGCLVEYQSSTLKDRVGHVDLPILQRFSFVNRMSVFDRLLIGDIVLWLLR